MPSIPSMQENPKGLHQRYVVSKANGEPVDAEAIYFVLRLDSKGDDKAHIAACRAAARAYCEHVDGSNFAEHLWQIAEDLHRLVNKLEDSE